MKLQSFSPSPHQFRRRAAHPICTEYQIGNLIRDCSLAGVGGSKLRRQRFPSERERVRMSRTCCTFFLARPTEHRQSRVRRIPVRRAAHGAKSDGWILSPNLSILQHHGIRRLRRPGSVAECRGGRSTQRPLPQDLPAIRSNPLCIARVIRRYIASQ